MNVSKQNLLDIVDEQKKTIEKYSIKLRDIVAAHKGVLVEKKALEDTIKLLAENKVAVEKTNAELKESDETTSSVSEDSENELKNKLTNLLISFSNLVAEKSNMEESYKIYQKQLIDDKEAVESTCKKLQEEVKTLTKQLKLAESKHGNKYSNLKKDSKNLCTTNPRNFKQSGNGEKPKALENELLILQVQNYEKELKNLRSELENKTKTNEVSDKKLKDTLFDLHKLQEEMRNMQIEHQAVLQEEKNKFKVVENEVKQVNAIQEERVANLESKLLVLSETIGTYDRLRLQDQTEIQKLKEHIAFLGVGQKESDTKKNIEHANNDDYDCLVKNILDLKNRVQIVAAKCGKEDDLLNIFPEFKKNDISHSDCKEAYNKIKADFELYKSEVKLNNTQLNSSKDIIGLQNQNKNLQEKIRILSEKNKDLEKEYELQIEQLKKTNQNDKVRFKETLASSELDYRGRVWLLEEQLQKQRERSLALLEEKEQEIHSLQNTFQMFLPDYVKKSEDQFAKDNSILVNQLIDVPHMVHYANELARRDIEISSLRKSKHQTEMALRDLQKELISLAEKYKEEVKQLKNEIGRLQRCQTREGANLEYLKNVVFNFLLSSDPKSKRHMCNAIAAVLKFSDSEIKEVVEHNQNKWWTKSSYL